MRCLFVFLKLYIYAICRILRKYMTAVNTMTELINRELGKASCFFYSHFIRLYKNLFSFAIAAYILLIGLPRARSEQY
jgi:hypothetical protein